MDMISSVEQSLRLIISHPRNHAQAMTRRTERISYEDEEDDEDVRWGGGCVSGDLLLRVRWFIRRMKRSMSIQQNRNSGEGKGREERCSIETGDNEEEYRSGSGSRGDRGIFWERRMKRGGRRRRSGWRGQRDAGRSGGGGSRKEDHMKRNNRRKIDSSSRRLSLLALNDVVVAVVVDRAREDAAAAAVICSCSWILMSARCCCCSGRGGNTHCASTIITAAGQWWCTIQSKAPQKTKGGKRFQSVLARVDYLPLLLCSSSSSSCPPASVCLVLVALWVSTLGDGAAGIGQHAQQIRSRWSSGQKSR